MNSVCPFLLPTVYVYILRLDTTRSHLNSFGGQNHDNQVNITHLEEIQREQLVAPLSYTRVAPPGVGGEDGPGNYWVPVSKQVSPLIQFD